MEVWTADEHYLMVTINSTVQEVATWFANYKGGKFTQQFQDISGKELLRLSEDQLAKIIGALQASLLFNELHPESTQTNDMLRVEFEQLKRKYEDQQHEIDTLKESFKRQKKEDAAQGDTEAPHHSTTTTTTSSTSATSYFGTASPENKPSPLHASIILEEGTRINVFWNAQDAGSEEKAGYYKGTVRRVETDKAKYIIKYDDHDSSVEEDYDFSGRDWLLL